MILPASYANGFAPRDGQPLYPGLWRGCAGAWNPGLGVVGPTVRSNIKSRADFTFVSSPTWVPNKQWTVRFATSSYMHIATSPVQTYPFSVSFWQYGYSTGVTFSMLHTANANWNGWYFGGAAFTTVVNNSFETTAPASSNADYTKMQHVLLVARSSTNRQIYLDGVPGTVGTQSLNPTGTFRLCFGASYRGAMIDNFATVQVTDIMIYPRDVSGDLLPVLKQRPGIAYEMAPRRRSRVSVQFNRRRRLLLGAS